MYYIESIIDGVLMCKTMPNGKWRPVKHKADAVTELMALGDSDRLSIFDLFCLKCGAVKPPRDASFKHYC